MPPAPAIAAPRERADELVERIVAPDILAHGDDAAAGTPERSRVNRAGLAIQPSVAAEGDAMADDDLVPALSVEPSATTRAGTPASRGSRCRRDRSPSAPPCCAPPARPRPRVFGAARSAARRRFGATISSVLDLVGVSATTPSVRLNRPRNPPDQPASPSSRHGSSRYR